MAITRYDTQTVQTINLFLLIFIVLFLIGCNNQNQLTRKEKNHISEIEKQIVQDPKGGENFNSFFQYFKLDTVFQFERTALPFVTHGELVTINAAGDMKDTLIRSFDKSELRFFEWDSRKPQGVEIRNDSAFMIYKDSAYVREYIDKQIFIRSNGHWYLKDEDIIILNPEY